MKTIAATQNWLDNWQTEVALAGCEYCDCTFLLPPGRLPMRCPHCGQEELTGMDETADKPVYTQPPELILSCTVARQQAQQKLQLFARGAWFAPPELRPERLYGRLHLLYLPLWLVDADVQAQWQAEMGFNYQVLSHKEEYRQDQWHTQEVKETRIRWQPCLGRLQRRYDNRIAPALEEQAQLEKQLGPFDWRQARPYQPAAITGALVRLPNRAPDDAWADAQHAFMQAAGEECRQAAAADHSRQYQWQPQFTGIHWTQLLYPLYTATYADDEGRSHTLYIHGQTGRLVGRRRASMKKAGQWSLGLGAAAALLFAFSFITFLSGYFLRVEVAIMVTGWLLVAGLLTAVAAFIPIFIAWYINRENKETVL